MREEDVAQLFDDMLAEAGTYAILRKSTKPATITLESRMAAALGHQQRKRISFLRVVIDAIVNKLYIRKVVSPDATLISLIDLQVLRTIFRYVSRDGRAYGLLTWEDGAPKWYAVEQFNGDNGAFLSRDGDEDIAVNTWVHDDVRYLDLYYADRIEKYKNKGTKWEHRYEDLNENRRYIWPTPYTTVDGTPLGIPFYAFGDNHSDVGNAVQLQTDLNEAILDLLAMSRTQGWPQRYIKGENNAAYLRNPSGNTVVDFTGMPIRREQLRPVPGSIMLLSGENAELNQLAAQGVDTGVIDKLIELLSMVTDVPHFYFKGDFPSGVALIQAETRLNARVEDKQEILTPQIIAALRYVMSLANIYTSASYNLSIPIDIDWHPPAVITYDLQMDEKKVTVESVATLYEKGLMSLETAIRTLHPDYDDTQIAAEIGRLASQENAQPDPQGTNTPV